ncbi:MAG TPA: iron export ABC transporter permease subunit FetB [Symbiobacteriaceae bacterium]|nr:iron export ABC transporter permease subunit FetB [Symbiobacteriaceae bacterium]
MTEWSLILTPLFVIVVAMVSMWQRLGLERDLVVGTIRAALQLTAVGYVLQWIFGVGSWPGILIMLTVMLAVATQHAAKKGAGLPGVWLWTFAAIGLAEVVTVGLMLVLRIIPPTAQYLIPISGMVIGNAMVNAGLLLNRLQAEMAARRGEVEVWLSLGATPRQAAANVLQSAVKAAMIPSVDALKTVGLVQLPGMMTGQILAGASPVEAVKYQILVMYSLAAAAAVCSITLGRLCLRLHFNQSAQLVR